jgi:hypothetical protein
VSKSVSVDIGMLQSSVASACIDLIEMYDKDLIRFIEGFQRGSTFNVTVVCLLFLLYSPFLLRIFVFYFIPSYFYSSYFLDFFLYLW